MVGASEAAHALSFLLKMDGRLVELHLQALGRTWSRWMAMTVRRSLVIPAL